MHDLNRNGFSGKQGILLGRKNRELCRLGTDRHLMTMAPNRAGKGVSPIIPDLPTWLDSVPMIDPKRQNAIVTARRRQAMGLSVPVLDR